MGGPHNTAEPFPCPLEQKEHNKSENENAWICFKKISFLNWVSLNVETTGIRENYFSFFETGKKNSSPATSFCYMNVETLTSPSYNRKMKKYIFPFKSEKMHKSFLMKKCTNPSNELLLHRCRNNFFSLSFSNLKKIYKSG